MVVEAVDVWDCGLAERAGATHRPLSLLFFLLTPELLLCDPVLRVLSQHVELLLAVAMRSVWWLLPYFGIAPRKLALTDDGIEGGCLSHRRSIAVELDGTLGLGCLSGLGLLRVMVLLLVAY